MSTPYILELERVIFDLADGSSEWYEIQEQTGLSDERCREIAETVKFVQHRCLTSKPKEQPQ